MSKLIVFALGVFLLFFGCLEQQEQDSEGSLSNYPLENESIQNISQPDPQPNISTSNQSHNQSSGAGSQDTNQFNISSLPLQELPPSLLECQSGSSLQNVTCTADVAIDSQNVSLCSYLDSKDMRFSCISMWCISVARNFSQCEQLSTYDERLVCLNKCNPNANT